MPRALAVAGERSGVGKTTISLAILAGLAKLSKTASAFKVGPDFIDKTHLAKFAVRVRNLDLFMSSENFVKYNFASASSEFNLIEGTMGIFDGEFSTADVLRATGVPCIVVLDASASAHTLGAVARGIVEFARKVEVEVIGFVVNGVGSELHRRMVLRGFEVAGLGKMLFGFVPRLRELRIPSRHLGLLMEWETTPPSHALEEIFFKHLAWRKILRAFADTDVSASWTVKEKVEGVKVGVAFDKAFCFWYDENTALLERLGAEVVFFSPLAGELPSDADLLIFPGGYPEIYADGIPERFFKALDKFCGVIWSECGGLEFLSSKIVWKDKVVRGAGILPFEIEICDSVQAIGWRRVSFLHPFRARFRGHEFHWGRIKRMSGRVKVCAKKYSVYRGFAGDEAFCVRKGGKVVFALWTHIYMPSSPDFVAKLLRFSAKHSGKTKKRCFQRKI